MPEYVQIISCEPQLDGRFYDDMTSSTLERELAEWAHRFPSRRAVVLYRESYDWIRLSAMALRGGSVEVHRLELSCDSDRATDVGAKAAPEVPVEVDVEADRFADLLTRVAESARVWESEGCTLKLPFQYRTPGSACESFAIVARHLVLPEERFVVEIEGSFYRAIVRRGVGATLEPLHVLTATRDADVRAIVRRAFDRPAQAVTRPCPAADAWLSSAPEASSPLTTGSFESRKDAAWRLVYPQITEGDTTRTAGPIVSSEVFEALAAALRAPQNASDAATEFRAEGYRLLMKAAPKKSPAAALMLERLSNEPEAVRAVIYTEIARAKKSAAAAAALVRGYKDEGPDLRRKLGQILWRNDRAVELLVRSELVPSWGKDENWCERIVGLLREELLPVPIAWLEGAPEALVEALGSQVRK